eukprot:TRINITY_DN13487_c0_g1_i3.p1 TRINITY_DN13487_c0_g1~~TRINITY_DN13487_c0_g1_i3.p1  ORF type:complete len:360 (-),score=74.48 TRINITY_DN13487_c0_g1_i3:236-1315(-)
MSQDTGTGWTAVVININNALDVAQHAGPGGWNDGSLQLTPGMGCHSAGLADPPTPTDNCMSNARFVTQYSAWCMLAMNLLLVGNFSALNPFVMSTWSNPELLAINQDPMGQAAFRPEGTMATKAYQSAKMSECGGEPELQEWSLNPAGQISNPASKTCLNVMGCKTEIVCHGCVNATVGCGPNEEFHQSSSGQLVSSLPGAQCVTEDTDRTLHLAPCSTSSTQSFNFSAGRLTDANSLCLTAQAAPGTNSHIILARALSGDSSGKAARIAAATVGGESALVAGFGLMLINNDVRDANLSCTATCLESAGLDASIEYQVRDVVARATLGVIGGNHTFGVVAEVAAGGESKVFRLTPAGVI